MVGEVMEKNITGTMFYYYFVCKRKLWYFSQNIEMEQNSSNVEIGKFIDENYYKRDEKHINIDNVINIDFIKDKDVIHEIKKSRKIEQAGIMQVKYYLYYLRKKGVDINAQIDYPLLKKVMEIKLEDEDVEIIENTLKDIEKTISLKLPPSKIKSGICKSCAYFDLCNI